MKVSTIIIVIILAVIILFFLGWSRVPDMIANRLASKLKVSVMIDDVDLLPQKVTIQKIQIGNPTGYTKFPRAFSADEIQFHSLLTNYLKEKIVIDEIDIDGIYLGLEFDSASGPKGNWTVMMGNFEREMKRESQKSTKNRSILIKRLVLRNITTEVYFDKDGGSVKKLPVINEIVLTNITSEGGMPMDQLMSTVLGQMLLSVFQKQNLQNMLKGILESPEKAIDTFVKPFKGLFTN